MRARFSPAGLCTALLLVPLLLLLGRLGVFAGHSAAMIAFPWQIDFDEGVILHSSWLLALGQTPYPPLAPDYFISSVYPPLFYALNAVALKLWGLNLWSGRALSLAGTLLAGGALVVWVRAETRSVAAGVVAAACWLACGPVIVWATFYKQDVLALGLGALGTALLAVASPPARFTTEARRHGGRLTNVPDSGLPNTFRQSVGLRPPALGRWTSTLQAVPLFRPVLLAATAGRPGAPAGGVDLAATSTETAPAVELPASAGAKKTVHTLPPLAWWAILPLVLAFWTKQSTLMGLGAGAIYLCLRDWRSGWRWTLAAGAALVGPFLLANLATGGQLYTHLFLPGAEELTGARLAKNMGALWDEHWPLVLLAGTAALVLVGQAIRMRRPPPLSFWHMLVSVPAVVWTNLSPLANYNHLLPALLPICLLAGVGLGLAAAWAAGPARTPLGLRLLPLAGALALLLVQPSLFTPFNTWYTPLGQPLSEKADRYALLEREVAAAPGAAVLTEDAWLALKAGKNLPFDDPAMLAIQANSGRWDPGVFLADIARRKFGLVVLEHDIAGETYSPRWTPAALTALQANYASKFRDVRFLYVPQPPPAEAPQALTCTLAGGPRLAGIFLPGGGAHLDAGDTQQLSLYWVPGAGPPQPGLKFSIRLLDPQGSAAWQADLPPGAAAGHPWPAWPGGLAPRDDLLVQVPATAASGAYRLVLSAYVQAGSQFTPVPFSCANGPAGPALTLATPQVARPGGAP